MPARCASFVFLLICTAIAVTGCQPSRTPKSRAANTVTAQAPHAASTADDTPAAVADSPSGDPPSEPADESPAAEPATADAKKPAADAPTHPSIPPLSECRWATGPIKIDGKLDEAAWQGAQVIDAFQIPWLTKENARPPRTATRARLLWDKEYLYFAADMDDADLYADVTENDGDVWDNDVFELFFKPHDDQPGYYEFEVSPANTLLDMYLPMRNAGGYLRFKKTQDFKWETAVQLRGTLNDWNDKDEGWSVEGRIPWTDFAPTGGRPNIESRWKFTLCRYDYSVAFEGPELSTVAPLRFVNFHFHDDYVPLRFVGPEATAKKWPHGIERRTQWTASQVKGTPEPPPPYRVKKTFEKLQIRQPLCIYPEPGTDKLLVVQHLGSWAGPAKILRVKDDPESSEQEEILHMDRIAYGIAFHKDYEKNGFIFVGSNGPVVIKDPAKDKKTTRVSRYTVSREAPYKVDPASELVIIEWESDGHNGGDLGFSPKDGYLYVTSGDGTSDSDTNLTGQDMSSLCAKTLRLDIDHPDEGRNYSVPKDNPFVGQEGVRPETWAYGFRNPWRMTFDRKNGNLWVAQNGQDLWEQVYLVKPGENYGWSVQEGSHPFYMERKRGPSPIIPPTCEHSHAEARSLTGGKVYYGSKLPDLVGAYIYGDWSTGKIWGVKHDGTRVTWHQELTDSPLAIGGFGIDHEGELFVIDQAGAGGFYRLEPTPKETGDVKFPRKLSESGFFTDTAKHEVYPGVIPYSVNVPQWSDGASSERYMGIPGDGRIDFPTWRGWVLPEGSVVIKTLSMEMEQGNPASKKRIETQLMVRQLNEWQAYTYAWNDDQTDAELVPVDGLDKVISIQDPAADGGVRQQPWRFTSRSECMGCHSRAANYVLGLTDWQFNRAHNYGGVTDQQFRVLEHLGIFKISLLEHENQLYSKVMDAILKPYNRYVAHETRVAKRRAERKAAEAAEAAKTAAAKKPEPKKAGVATTEAPKPDDPAATTVAKPAKKVVWNYPGDFTLYLPGEFEWARRAAVQARTRLRTEIQTRQLTTNRLPQPIASYRKLVDPYDESLDLDARARSYLHANCSQCHVAAGGGNAAMELEVNVERDKTMLFGAKPLHATFGIPDAKIVTPGDPHRSILYYRIAKLGGGRMPRIGSNAVDPGATKLFYDWIKQQQPAEGAKVDPAIVKARQEEAALAARLAADKGAKKMTPTATKEAVTKLLKTTTGSLELLRLVDRDQLPAEVKTTAIKLAVAGEPQVRDLFERYVPLQQRTKRLGPVINIAALAAVEGQAQRGRELFHNTVTLSCKNCHRIGKGPELPGPDLSQIGKKYNRLQLLESIVEPSKKIDKQYIPYLIQTSDGLVHTGLLVKESETEVVLKDAKNLDIRIPRADIESMDPQTKSLMPEMLLQELTAQQAADLVEYLSTLK